jgi:hypothetical protein
MERYRIPAILTAVCLTVITLISIISCSPAPAQQVSQTSQVSQPALVCSPDRLNFTARVGQVTPMEQVINISNQGGGVLSWTVSDNVRWTDEQQMLGVNGLQGGTVKAVIDPSGMAAGEYTGIITILAEGALGSPCHVPVFLTITPTESAPATPAPAQQSLQPADTAVIWKNQTDLVQYSSTNSCIVSGSITNTDRWWYLNNVTITASTGSALIATTLPPGEKVIYSRYIPCYQRENVKLVYNWYKP